jgi:hypothetical protein
MLAIDQSAKDSRPLDVNPPLRLVPGLRLLAFRFPVSSYFTAWKGGEQPLWPDREPQYVALLRRDYIVRRHELTAWQYDLLSHLAAGRTLDESLASIAAQADSIDSLAADVRRWFTNWSAEGFFTSPPQTT